MTGKSRDSSIDSIVLQAVSVHPSNVSGVFTISDGGVDVKLTELELNTSSLCSPARISYLVMSWQPFLWEAFTGFCKVQPFML